MLGYNSMRISAASDRFLLLLQPIFPRIFGILHEKDRKFFLSP